MMEEREGEQGSKSDSIATPPSPVRKLLNGKKPSDSSLNRYPLRLRDPDLSNCHVCGSQIISKRGNDKLQTLDSQWRIVIICNDCFMNVQSAKVCSYCFTEISELGISCRHCGYRVHQGCKSMYGRLNFRCDLASFTCIDCWVPRSIKNCNGKHNGTSGIATNSSSSKVARVSSDVRDCSNSLQDAAKDAKMTAEMKLANAARAREKALEKAVAARQAAEMAAKALDVAAVVATEESQVDGSCPVVDDAKLALRLHRAINSSPRIFKNVRSTKLDKLVYKKKLKLATSSFATLSDPGNQIVCDLEVGTDFILENPDKAASETSVQIGIIDHPSSNDLGTTLESRTKMELREGHGELRINGEVGRMINSERISDANNVKMSAGIDCVAELSMKEDQASCSSKVTISSGKYNSTDSVSHCGQNREGLNRNGMLNNKVIQCQSIYDRNSFQLEKKSPHGPDMFLRKYGRKCKGHNRYVRKYTRRCTKSKGIFDRNTDFCPETFHLESQASGTALPLMQMHNDNEALTSIDTSVRSPCVPSQASTSATDLS